MATDHLTGVMLALATMTVCVVLVAGSSADGFIGVDDENNLRVDAPLDGRVLVAGVDCAAEVAALKTTVAALLSETAALRNETAALRQKTNLLEAQQHQASTDNTLLARVAALESDGNLVQDADLQATNKSWSVPVTAVLTPWQDGQMIHAARSVEDNTVGCYPGWGTTNKFAINPAHTYQFNLWIKSSGKDLVNFFGFLLFDAGGNSVNVPGQHGNLDPYFKNTLSDGPDWKLHTGYLLAKHSSSANGTLPGKGYVLPPDAAFAQLTFGSCYGDGDASGEAYFAFPSVKIWQPLSVEANQEAIAELTAENLDLNLVTGSDLSDTSLWWDPPSDVVQTTFIDGAVVTAARSREQNFTGYCYGGWGRTNLASIDPLGLYEFGVWIKAQNRASEMQNFFGFLVFTDERVRIKDGQYSNRYFKSTAPGTDSDDWVHWVGFLLPHTTPASLVSGGSQTPIHINHPDARLALLRFGSCYGDGDEEDSTLYAFPSIRRLDTKRQRLADKLLEGLDPLAGENLVKNPEMTDAAAHGWLEAPANVSFVVFENTPVTAAVVYETNVADACHSGRPRSNIFAVDPSKDYEFSIYIKTNDATIKHYFGFQVFTSDSPNDRYTTGNYSLPYFKTSRGDRDVWTRHVGYLRHTGSGSSENSFEIPPECNHAVLVFRSCYGDGDGLGSSWFAFPTVRQLS